jgi:hypothetical protein
VILYFKGLKILATPLIASFRDKYCGKVINELASTPLVLLPELGKRTNPLIFSWYAMNSILRSNFTHFVSRFIRREWYTCEQGDFLFKNRLLIFSSVFFFIVILLWRSWPNFTNPGLYVEDTGHYFNYFYGNTQDTSSLFNNPNGYYNIINNLIAFLTAKIDVRFQPTLYLWTATFLAVCAVMTVSCSGLLRNKYVLFIAPFLLGLSGLNHLYYYITLAYQIYVLVILLIGLLFWKPLEGNTSNVLLFILLSILIWSGPYSVLVVPFSCLFILFFRGKTKLLIFLSLVTILYTLSVTEHMILLRNIWKGEIHRIWFNTLIARVFFMDLKGAVGPVKILITSVFFLTILAIFRKDTFYLKVACILLVLIYSSLGALFLSKKFLLSLKIRSCYIVVAQFFWLFFLLFTADRILAINKKFYHGGIVVCVLVVMFIFYDNTKNPSKRTMPLMPALPIFLSKVYEAEHENLKATNRVKIFQLGSKDFSPIARVGKTDDPSISIEFIQIDAKE